MYICLVSTVVVQTGCLMVGVMAQICSERPHNYGLCARSGYFICSHANIVLLCSVYHLIQLPNKNIEYNIYI